MNSSQAGVANQIASAALVDLQDEKIYGDIGKPFKPHPMYPETPDLTEQMEWNWFPNVSVAAVRRYFTVERCLVFGTVFCSFIATILFIRAATKMFGNNAGEGIGGFIFLILGFSFLYSRIIIGMHKTKRKATCIALGRSKQALELWKNTPGPGYEAKDEFFKNHFYRVLRNGTVEAIITEATPTDASDLVKEMNNTNKFINDSQSVILNVDDSGNDESNE